MKARVINLRGSKCTTNVQEIIDLDGEHTIPNTSQITSIFNNVFHEIEVRGLEVMKSSLVREDGTLTFSASSAFNYYFSMMTYEECSHCKKLYQIHGDHEIDCPYRVILDVIES